MSDSVEVQLKGILDEVSKEVRDGVNDAAKSVGREAARQLRATSPKREGDYAGGWGIKTERGAGGSIRVIVRNSKMPGLTHLLEKGHLTRNKYGVWGRTPAHVHIAPVEEWANEEFAKRAEEILK